MKKGNLPLSCGCSDFLCEMFTTAKQQMRLYGGVFALRSASAETAHKEHIKVHIKKNKKKQEEADKGVCCSPRYYLTWWVMTQAWPGQRGHSLL